MIKFIGLIGRRPLLQRPLHKLLTSPNWGPLRPVCGGLVLTDIDARALPAEHLANAQVACHRAACPATSSAAAVPVSKSPREFLSNEIRNCKNFQGVALAAHMCYCRLGLRAPGIHHRTGPPLEPSNLHSAYPGLGSSPQFVGSVGSIYNLQ